MYDFPCFLKFSASSYYFFYSAAFSAATWAGDLIGGGLKIASASFFNDFLDSADGGRVWIGAS